MNQSKQLTQGLVIEHKFPYFADFFGLLSNDSPFRPLLFLEITDKHRTALRHESLKYQKHNYNNNTL